MNSRTQPEDPSETDAYIITFILSTQEPMRRRLGMACLLLPEKDKRVSSLMKKAVKTKKQGSLDELRIYVDSKITGLEARS